MRKADALDRDLIAEAIRSVVDEVVREHYGALTQEHQLSSRICGALEAKLRHATFGEYRVEVVTQEAPDKGPNSLEKKSGIDLYIGIRIDDGAVVSKGLLVQAKWNDGARNAAEQARLVEQCQKIDARTDAGYVWLYGTSGVQVVPAKEVVANPSTAPEELGSRHLNEVFGQVLDCFEGDRRLALPTGPDLRRDLGVMLEEFGATTGVAVSLTGREAERRDSGPPWEI